MNKLLLINDLDGIQEILASLLAATKWRIEPALDGNEALRLYRKRGPYDLVLTDIRHPGPNGIEIVKRIRRKNPKQAIAVFSAVGGKVEMEIRTRFKIPVSPITFEKKKFVRLVESSVKPQRRVLIIAGDSAVRPLTTFCTNFEAELEFTGNKALKRYRERGPYDLVVTGYRHRGLDGIGLASAILKQNPTQRIAVITGESAPTLRRLRRRLPSAEVLSVWSVIRVLVKKGKAENLLYANLVRRLAQKLKWDEQTRRKEIADARFANPIATALAQLSMHGAEGLVELVDAAKAIGSKKKTARATRAGVVDRKSAGS